MGWAGNVWTGAERWIDAENTWRRLKGELLPNLYLEVMEEVLVADPEGVLNRVCGFVGVAYNRHMLEYHRATSYTKPDPKLIYQWKEKLTPAEVQLVESKTGAMLTEAGYRPSGLPRIRPSVFMRVFLKIQDKISRLKYRWGYMGFNLFVSDWLSRKLHITSWQDKLRPRIHETGRVRLK
jgi:hypothetical protein